ncbi:hypothetical protein HOL21_00535 [Candidatus Woesearchaeota archaeon]|mgnify:CR=1 FL=1|jgi:Fe-S-cluster containining protein|nr:hypothetical protein [Candidatus Woesearchaeota archaeon]MBT5396683.1 hypothetical protein [Candidatus Woesearchaeota archaeon]MBT5924372.1 hypothetical protein [Candidatus Woesearchaeota archaeon]MBT6367530.1 hypothetical protein [Candidatus Woesearchaeota archaeon]MBT7763029.1 hypothetical protein [Candidatus Woesearchaeota archaeon]
MASICNGPKARYCRSACCYIKNKPVHTSEVEDLGLENIVEKRGGLYLKNKDKFGTCIFLDEDSLLCEIALQIPFWCQTYTCFGHKGMDKFVEEVWYHRKKKGFR